jgi:hypothetical protein
MKKKVEQPRPQLGQTWILKRDEWSPFEEVVVDKVGLFGDVFAKNKNGTQVCMTQNNFTNEYRPKGKDD